MEACPHSRTPAQLGGQIPPLATQPLMASLNVIPDTSDRAKAGASTRGTIGDRPRFRSFEGDRPRFRELRRGQTTLCTRILNTCFLATAKRGLSPIVRSPIVRSVPPR